MAIANRLFKNFSILHMTYFCIGLFSLISQTMIIREFLVVVYGNEIILGVLFFNWLAGIFIGALSGGPAADKSKHPTLLFVISILVMCLLMPAAITCTRLLYAISSTAAGTYIGFFKVFLCSGIFIIPMAFFIGFSFPLAARVQLTGKADKTEKVQKISHIYIFEALGFLVGGIVYTFFLVGRFNPYFIASLAILPLLLFSAVILGQAKYYKTLILTLILLVLNAAALVPAVNGRAEDLTVKKRWRSVSPTRLLYSTDSKYQNIAVSGLFNQYNLYLNTMYAAVIPGDEENMILAAHLFCQHPAPKRILIIGDALTGLAKYLLAYKLEKIVSVEIDPLVVETILKFLPAEEKKVLQEKRFAVVIKDGRKYVKELSSKPTSFDIVFLNLPEPATLLLNRYYTMDFFLDLAKIVPEQGIIALKITSSENYSQGLVSDYTASLYHTVAAVFPETVVAPGTHNFIFATRKKNTLSANPEILAQRYEKSGAKPEKLGMIFHSLYPQDKTGIIKKALESSTKATINRDDHPNANFYFSKILGWYAGGKLTGILNFFEKISFKVLLSFLILLFLLRLIYICRKKKNTTRFHILLAVFCCGMAGLSLELVLLYTFQNIFGYIYHIIGFIIALFMFGLPLGALFANLLLNKKRLKAETGIIKLMILLQISLAVISLLPGQINKILVNSSLVNQIFIFSLTVLIGFAVGMIFPLALNIYLSQKEKTGKAAGIVDAYDHLGAAVGALFMGTLFLPLLGVFNVCLLASLFLLASSLLLTAGTFAFCSR